MILGSAPEPPFELVPLLSRDITALEKGHSGEANSGIKHDDDDDMLWVPQGDACGCRGGVRMLADEIAGAWLDTTATLSLRTPHSMGGVAAALDASNGGLAEVARFRRSVPGGQHQRLCVVVPGGKRDPSGRGALRR